MHRGLVYCLVLLVLVCCWERPSAVARTIGEPIALVFESVLLNADDPDQITLGPLTYQHGWSISSDHAYFGGWSALSLTRSRMVMLSDRGAWLLARFTPKSVTEPLQEPEIGIIAGRGPTWFDKERTDLEAMVPFYPFGFLVAFEHGHRLAVMTELGGWLAPVPMPPGVMEGLSPNSGIEAMTFDQKDRLLLFAERGRRPGYGLPAWRISARPNGEKASETFGLVLPAGHAPTAARRLKDGRILILSRSFSALRGTNIGLHLLSLGDKVTGRSFRPRQIAELQSPLVTDNFEGMDLAPVQGSDQRYTLLLLSDDNVNPVQRTLLLTFDLDLSKL